MHAFLGREGYIASHSFRPDRGEKLNLRKRCRRKRGSARAPVLAPLQPNERQSVDFVSDRFSDRFHILAVIADCTRENLAPVADTSPSGLRVNRPGFSGSSNF